ncbi:hypothetical protein PLESTM_000460800 [Pleodorina starrii]|nr:hypothetical protein PLESTM_000460800 [Pleodorina starrii]
MPPDTMTLAGHNSEGVQLVRQHNSDPSSARPNQSRPSDDSTASSVSSFWHEGLASGMVKANASVAPTGAASGVQSFVHSHVPHCKQYFNWDCGLACVQMILQASGFPHCDYRILRQFCATTSIWTVDLAHLLRRFGLAVSFFTVTLGPNPAYANESFYMENMEDDERRVSQLFVDAARVGIEVQQRSISSEELQFWLLSGSCLVIVLVDKRKLDPWLAAADMCLPSLCGMELGYTGHYVLVVGYDGVSQEYVVRDPAAQEPDLRVSAAALDAARRSFGTDEDILVVGCGGCGCAMGTHAQQQQQQQQWGAAAVAAAGGGDGGGGLESGPGRGAGEVGGGERRGAAGAG